MSDALCALGLTGIRCVDALFAPDWLGCACGARPPLIGWRKRSLPLLGAELRPEAMKSPPTSSAKNTGVMATGRVREGGVVVVVDVVVVAVVVVGVKILTIK